MNTMVSILTKIIVTLTSQNSRTILAIIASVAVAVVVVVPPFFFSFFLSQRIAHNMVMVLLR